MMFSKRHYKAVAKVLAANRPSRDEAWASEHQNGAIMQHSILREQIANLFRQDNLRFDIDRFTAACEK